MEGFTVNAKGEKTNETEDGQVEKRTNYPKTRVPRTENTIKTSLRKGRCGKRTHGAQSVRENKAVKGVFAFTSHVLHGPESGSVCPRLQTLPLYSNTASLGNAPALRRCYKRPFF